MLLKPILLAEDDSNDVFLFWRMHKRCRIQNPVEVFPDRQEVVRYLEGGRRRWPLPAVLFLELKLPLMDGLEVLEYLRASVHRGLPTVILTGNQDFRLMARAYELGAYSYFMKPILQNEFCDLMARIAGVMMGGYVEEQRLGSAAAKPLRQTGGFVCKLSALRRSASREPPQDPFCGAFRVESGGGGRAGTVCDQDLSGSAC